MDARIKAILIAEGSADIDPELLGISRTSTAGPGAGVESFFFRSNGHRVRLDSKRDPDASLKVRRVGGDTRDADCVAILHNGRELVRGRIEPALLHCPEQAYITISESCIFNCTFCPVPKLRGRTKSLEEIVRMVDDVYRTKKMRAIAITSGIEHSPEEEVIRAVNAVNALARYNLPIGVSVYPTNDSSLRLKEAGAIEIKYNVETMDRAIFKRACADMDLDFVLAALEDAVNIFGRNRVFSNFIIGLGESDETVKSGVRELAGLGVIPILRALNLHPLRPDLKEVCPDAGRPDADRLLRLAEYEREVLDAHGLRADIAETMCLPCGGCDLVPHRDV